MSYQARNLEEAQKQIDALTKALRFWIPDDLPPDDVDYERWTADWNLAEGGSARITNSPEISS